MKLENQVAVIVGGARGIGEAIAHTFAAEGAKIVLVDLERTKTELDGVVQAIQQKGDEAVAMTADATDFAQVQRMVTDVVDRYGSLDILVNSVGFRGPMVEVHEITEEEWDAVLNVNLKAIFLCCKAALKVMIEQKRGSIVSISGTAGREGMALRGSLCAAKWGLLGMTQTIAKEAGPSGVRAKHHLPRGHGRGRPAGDVPRPGQGPRRHVRGVVGERPVPHPAAEARTARRGGQRRAVPRIERLVSYHRGGVERVGWAVDVLSSLARRVSNLAHVAVHSLKRGAGHSTSHGKSVKSLQR